MRKWCVSLLVLSFCAAIPAQASALAPPTIQYFGASPIRNHEATLRFSIDPEGLATDFEVKFGTAPGEYVPYSYWEFELPAGDDPKMVEARLPAHWMPTLRAGTKYHWIVIAENSAGKTEGPEQHFTTTNGPRPDVVTGAAADQTLTSARFTGTVDPEGFPLTYCRFRYVTEMTFFYKGFEANGGGGTMPLGQTVPCAESLEEIGAGDGPVAVHADVSELKPGPYRFRLETENQFVAAAGEGSAFGPPWIGSPWVSSVGANEATVAVVFQKYWADGGEYRVEYAAGGVWQQTPWAEAPQTTFPEVTLDLNCLWPDTEYHFRFVARNQAGTTSGPEGTFTTLPGAPACLQSPEPEPEPAPAPAPEPAPAALPAPLATSSSQPPSAAKQRKKQRKKHQRKRLRHNLTIVAPR